MLPGDIEALFDARIRARVSGYVRDWRYDIGAKVKAGEVLATIEAPELDRQLEQAKGETSRAVAEVELAKLTSKRWSALRASTAVSQQSVDEKSGDFSAKTAAVEAARANYERLKALQNFLQIVAPFAGVVTARHVDIGALVGPDRVQELFSVADVHQGARLCWNAADLFRRNRRRLDRDAEIAAVSGPPLRGESHRDLECDRREVPNACSCSFSPKILTACLLPGSYTEVHFKLPRAARGAARACRGNSLSRQ